MGGARVMTQRAVVIAAIAAGLVAVSVLIGPSAAVDASAGPDRQGVVLEDHGAGSQNETSVVRDGETLALEAGPGQVVRGRTDMEPGTVVTVRLQSTGADHPYLRSRSATVDADGVFRAVFDLSELPSGTGLRVVVHHDGRNLTTVAGEVVACSSCATTIPDTPSAVVVHDGDALTVENRSGQVVRGRTNLPPGTELTVRLRAGAGAAPFIEQTSMVVDANGTFRAVFGFGDLTQETEFGVAIRFNGTELTTTGRVSGHLRTAVDARRGDHASRQSCLPGGRGRRRPGRQRFGRTGPAAVG